MIFLNDVNHLTSPHKIKYLYLEIFSNVHFRDKHVIPWITSTRFDGLKATIE